MRLALVLAAVLVSAPRLLPAQERGAVALGEAVRGLGETVRVLMIGAHPDDEDTPLIAWLARGQRVETGYLSLTRGDGGQNLIGNELGPALGLVRTEELLAARRVDGGRQYFTRAYDFGYSRTAEETYEHWDKELVLRDVVSVVRAFRPHIIIAVFSGTPRDGHGHHQVAGMLAREAFDIAGDSTRMPARATGGVGPWTPLKFYRGQRFRPEGATLRVNVGEYNALLGRSYAEIAGASRSQHRSQGFGALQPKGVQWGFLRLEASRAKASAEQAMLDGVPGGWSRFATLELPPATRAAVDALAATANEVRADLSLREPSRAVASLARYVSLLRVAHDSLVIPDRDARRDDTRPCLAPHVPLCGEVLGDLAVSLEVELERAERALLEAAGIAVEANAARPVVAFGDTLPVAVRVFNRGRASVAVANISAGGEGTFANVARGVGRTLLPDSSTTDTIHLRPLVPHLNWWMVRPRVGGLFDIGDARGDTAASARYGVPQLLRGEDRVRSSAAVVHLEVAGAPVRAVASPVVYRHADPAEGEVRRPVASVPAVTVLLERQVEYVPAGRPIARVVRVTVQSAGTRERDVTVALTLPRGLRADSASRTVRLRPGRATGIAFTVSGVLPPGDATIRAVATSEGSTYTSGFVPVEYPHIAPLRFHRPAAMHLSVVDVRLPAGLNVAYIPGVGDNTPPMLRQLGVPVSVIEPADLATTDLARFTAIVVGPRAYESSDALVGANPRLLEFARRGGTVVVQYGQYEMMQQGILPYPVTIARPHDRVTLESAPVRILDPRAAMLRAPNVITLGDFSGWVQERGLYMPRSFDPAWTPLLESNDPGEEANRGAVLVAPVGRGTYVYTTLSFFRQLPAGVPGAARLFVNLLSGR